VGGIGVPKGTPAEIIDKLNKEVTTQVVLDSSRKAQGFGEV